MKLTSWPDETLHQEDGKLGRPRIPSETKALQGTLDNWAERKRKQADRAKLFAMDGKSVRIPPPSPTLSRLEKQEHRALATSLGGYYNPAQAPLFARTVQAAAKLGAKGLSQAAYGPLLASVMRMTAALQTGPVVAKNAPAAPRASDAPSEATVDEVAYRRRVRDGVE